MRFNRNDLITFTGWYFQLPVPNLCKWFASAAAGARRDKPEEFESAGRIIVPLATRYLGRLDPGAPGGSGGVSRDFEGGGACLTVHFMELHVFWGLFAGFFSRPRSFRRR